MTRPPARDGGFTLLELLVALVVFGFLLAGLGQGVHFGLQAWTRQTRTIDARDGLDAVDRALRGLITRLDPDAEVGGRAHALAFTSDLPLMANSPTRAADLLLLVDARHRLVLRWLPHLHAQRLGPPPPPRDEVMLEEVERVDIAYWATSGTWVDRWTDRTASPALIRVGLVFAPGDPRHWPDLVAAPMRVRQ
jgi:general secretion pathway protein J